MQMFTRADILAMEDRFRRNFVNCLPGMKPAMLCGTVDLNGVTNVSIVSQVMHVGANPPFMGVLFRPHTVERHSVENIGLTGFFSLNQIPETHIAQAHQTSARYPREVSEFDATGLTPLFEGNVPAPVVAESPVRIILRAVERRILAVNQTELVIGAVEAVWVNPDALSEDGFLDPGKNGISAVAGLDGYLSGGEWVRFDYAKADTPPRRKG